MTTDSPLKSLVRTARRASLEPSAIKRREAAAAVLRLPELTATELGPGRAAIGRALRSAVVALALTSDAGGRRAVGYAIKELANAALSEPPPPPLRIWWADHD